ncbi:MAG: RNA polymerase sigma factor [Planctomycetota bacterium]
MSKASSGAASPTQLSPPVATDAALRARLVRFAARLIGPGEAEDVVHEALTQGQRAGAGAAASPRAWLFVVTRRRALDRLRRREREARAREALAGAARAEAAPAGELAARREELTRLGRELESVREPFQTAVRLRYLEGLSFAEVAARIGVPERTARGRVARGLAALRERLKGGDA